MTTLQRAVSFCNSDWPGPCTRPSHTTATVFEEDCQACHLVVSGERMMACIGASIAPRPRMLAAVRTIRSRVLDALRGETRRTTR